MGCHACILNHHDIVYIDIYTCISIQKNTKTNHVHLWKPYRCFLEINSSLIQFYPASGAAFWRICLCNCTSTCAWKWLAASEKQVWKRGVRRQSFGAKWAWSGTYCRSCRSRAPFGCCGRLKSASVLCVGMLFPELLYNSWNPLITLLIY